MAKDGKQPERNDNLFMSLQHLAHDKLLTHPISPIATNKKKAVLAAGTASFLFSHTERPAGDKPCQAALDGIQGRAGAANTCEKVTFVTGYTKGTYVYPDL